MDATRVGVTFQEAQAVLRNIRNRRGETCERSFPRQYVHKNKPEIKREYNSACCFSESPYFSNASSNSIMKSEYSTSDPNNKKSFQGLYFQNKQVDKKLCPQNELEQFNSVPTYTFTSPVAHEKQAERKLCPQKALPKTSSIAKRLEEFKQSHVQKQQDHSKTNRFVSKSSSLNPKSGPLKMITSAENNNIFKLGSSNMQQKVKLPKCFSKKPNNTHTGNQMNITSYLPKVKHHNREKFDVKKQTNIEDFTPAEPERVTTAENIESMSLDERDLVKKKIFAASNIACTLVYVNGSTLLRPGTAKTQVKAIYLSFSECDTCSLEDCCCTLFPLPSLKVDDNSKYYQWLRDFFTNFMSNESNKVVYDAQKFIKTLINILNIEDHTVCFQWRCFDPKIASWLLDPDHPPEHYDALLRRSTFGNGKLSDNKSDQSNNANDQVYKDMYSLLSLIPDMFLALQENKLWELFSEVEMKISPILAVMELVGVQIDTQLLFDYGNSLEKKAKKLEQEGFKSVGHPFQMSSTQQIRQILFNELQLDKNVQKRLARTQIKNYKSTSENVLKHLQDFHPLPKIILEYRSVTKLKSAYVDGILGFVENSVLHTNWNQTCTATGRLTSTNPNIQAIPKNQLDITGVTKQFIIGKEMETTSIIPRKAFKSRNGWSFVSSDFQSIELRLLAHFSEDPLLLRIFHESEDDIFIQLASIWLSVDPKSVQSEDRERAKRVVYSVVYGVGKERLADTLNVSADQAKSFTTSFLATFTGLKLFIQSCINQCRKQGFVTTIFGRRRLLPGINSNDPLLRSQSERQAVNFVIQGSAADICKMGMILVAGSLNKDTKLRARLLVQIHDELVLEVHDDHLQGVTDMVKVCLEDTEALCGGRVKLKVNLKVSVSCGKTWAEMQAVQ